MPSVDIPHGLEAGVSGYFMLRQEAPSVLGKQIIAHVCCSKARTSVKLQSRADFHSVIYRAGILYKPKAVSIQLFVGLSV